MKTHLEKLLAYAEANDKKGAIKYLKSLPSDEANGVVEFMANDFNETVDNLFKETTMKLKALSELVEYIFIVKNNGNGEVSASTKMAPSTMVDIFTAVPKSKSFYDDDVYEMYAMQSVSTKNKYKA